MGTRLNVWLHACAARLGRWLLRWSGEAYLRGYVPVPPVLEAVRGAFVDVGLEPALCVPATNLAALGKLNEVVYHAILRLHRLPARTVLNVSQMPIFLHPNHHTLVTVGDVLEALS